MKLVSALFIKLCIFQCKNTRNQLESKKKLTLININILHLPSSVDFTTFPSRLNNVTLYTLQWKKLWTFFLTAVRNNLSCRKMETQIFNAFIQFITMKPEQVRWWQVKRSPAISSRHLFYCYCNKTVCLTCCKPNADDTQQEKSCNSRGHVSLSLSVWAQLGCFRESSSVWRCCCKEKRFTCIYIERKWNLTLTGNQEKLAPAWHVPCPVTYRFCSFMSCQKNPSVCSLNFLNETHYLCNCHLYKYTPSTQCLILQASYCMTPTLTFKPAIIYVRMKNDWEILRVKFDYVCKWQGPK